jgi:hypothetical protein
VSISKRIETQLVAGLKKFKPLILNARAKDVNEADTVTLVRDMLAELFGYDRYLEVTGEYAINRTYCDLAIKIDAKLTVLCEVKAIGLELKEQHTQQAVNYAANEGVPWVILTNGQRWQVWLVSLAGKVQRELVMDVDMCTLETRRLADVEKLYPLTRGGVFTGALGTLKQERRAINRHAVGAALMRDGVLSEVRRELARLEPGVRINVTALRSLLVAEVIKRDVIDADETAAFGKRFDAADRRDDRAKLNEVKKSVATDLGTTSELL